MYNQKYNPFEGLTPEQNEILKKPLTPEQIKKLSDNTINPFRLADTEDKK